MSFWQNPFVSILKTFKVRPDSGAPGLPSCAKCGEVCGDVKEEVDHQIRCQVWKIAGAISANNFLLFPKKNGGNLNLVGRYLYVAFKPTPLKDQFDNNS